MNDSSTSTVVTAYYSFPSKHTKNEYLQWMADVLATEMPMVIYTDQESLSILQQQRPSQLPTKYIVMPLSDFAWMTNYRSTAFWEQQQTMDTEEQHRNVSYKLYQVWNSKIEMVHQAAEHNWFGTTHFWWVDIGSLRNQQRIPSPWPARIPPIDDKVLVGNPMHDVIQGTFFGGTQHAICWYHTHYYAELHKRAQEGRFIGVDQHIMTALHKLHPDAFWVLDLSGYADWDTWFRFWAILGCITEV